MLVQRCALDQHRLILPVSVSKPALQAGQFHGSFSGKHYRALVDTGAQRTVLSERVIAELNLLRTGHMQFSGLHGPRTHTRYLASLGIWAHRVDRGGSGSRLDQNELSLFSLDEPIEIVNMDDNVNFDLILGFDVLKNFSFSFDSQSREFEITVSP